MESLSGSRVLTLSAPCDMGFSGEEWDIVLGFFLDEDLGIVRNFDELLLIILAVVKDLQGGTVEIGKQ